MAEQAQEHIDVHDAVRRYFAAPEYVYFEEVRNAAGFDANRTADGFAMGVWPSRGLEIHGIEIKATRSDWLREKRDPSKAEGGIYPFCDHWWLAVADCKIVQDGELPPTWGLLAPRGGSLVAKVPAPKLEPRPVDRHFLAALLKRAYQGNPDMLRIEAARKAGYDAAKKERHERDDALVEAKQQEIDRWAREAAAFKAASGVDFYPWNGGQIGKAVAFVQRGGLTQERKALEAVMIEARGVAERVEAFLRESEASNG